MNIDATRTHIDAETLAAWADRALPADVAASVELHLSNCDRCQEVLAAFLRSAPVTGAVVIPFWARRPVQWSAAGLVAAAALVAMIWIDRPPALPTPESTVASAPSVQPIPIPPFPTVQSVPPVSSPSATEPRQKKSVAEPSPALQGRTANLPPPAAASAAPPPSPVTLGGGVAAPVVTPVGATRPAAMSETVAMDAFSAIIPTFEIAAPDPSPAALRSVTGGAGRGAAAKALSQNANPTRWRVVAGTRVERTVDAGATWTALPIEPALTTPLVAGAATSQTNCWLVGRDGVVLVTNDGQTFRRVPVPEAINLTGVTAMDGLRATVTATDGRNFSTFDGGLTWK